MPAVPILMPSKIKWRRLKFYSFKKEIEQSVFKINYVKIICIVFNLIEFRAGRGGWDGGER